MEMTFDDFCCAADGALASIVRELEEHAGPLDLRYNSELGCAELIAAQEPAVARLWAKVLDGKVADMTIACRRGSEILGQIVGQLSRGTVLASY